MPRKDIFHDCVRNALTKDGWIITADPYTLEWGKDKVFVDLGAEKVFAAEKENTKIAVEVKSFVGHSQTDDLEKALGQYVLYELLIARQEPERKLFLAIPEEIFNDLFQGVKGEVLLEGGRMKVFAFVPEKEEITIWKD